MSNSEKSVKLLLETQAAIELHDAVAIALEAPAVSEIDKAGRNVFWMLVRKSTAIELRDALAVHLSLAPPARDNPSTTDQHDVVAIGVTERTATELLYAVMQSLDPETYSTINDAQPRKSGDVLEVVVGRVTAVQLLNSLVILGGVSNGMKADKGKGTDGWAGVEAEGPRKLDVTRNAGGSTSESDEVDCTVYAPGSCSPGNSFLVQVFAHLPEHSATLEQIAKEADPSTKRRVARTLDEKIQRGNRLAFNMTMPDVAIDEPSQSFVWNGKPASVQFAVTIPVDFKPRDIPCTIIVSEGSVPIGHLKFILKVVTAGAVAGSVSQPVQSAGLIRYQQAFISYASADRAEVLKRVQMLNATKVKYFQDLLTLEPGDRWEELIYDYIDRSDVVFLFWSKAASKSKWVAKETSYARKRQAGNDDAPPQIVPIVIEGPPPAKPPAKLNFLHFNDKFLYFIKVEEDLADA